MIRCAAVVSSVSLGVQVCVDTEKLLRVSLPPSKTDEPIRIFTLQLASALTLQFLWPQIRSGNLQG